jgi:3-oxoacyl-[acyl-carrier protein] reductase
MRALITGGSSGIGAAIVRGIVLDGWEVTFTYNAHETCAKELVASLSERPSSCIRAVKCDLSNRVDVSRLTLDLGAEDVSYDAFVHAAGRSADAIASVVDVDDAQATMEVNFWAAVRICRELLRPMSRNRRGHIVLIGSIAGTLGNRGNGIYSATKAALAGYVGSLVDEFGSRNVRVNCIAPGFIDTPLLASMGADVRRRVEARIPVGRFGRPEEIAHLVRFLLSEGAAYINGATFAIDGGLSATLGLDRPR